MQKLKKRGFILPVIDAVHYGEGEAVVYLIIDSFSGLPLFGWETLVRGRVDLAPFIAQLKSLNLPIVAIVSDKESGLAPAIADALPGVPHQFCQRHYLSNVAKPMEKGLADLGKICREKEEKLRAFERKIIRLETKLQSEGKTPPADLEIARDLCGAARTAARRHGRNLTDPSALKRQSEIKRVERAVKQAYRKKGGDWEHLKQLKEILRPAPREVVLAKRLVMFLMIVMGIKNILWPKTPPKSGAIVKRRLMSFLKIQLSEASKPRQGAFLRGFVEHAMKITLSYLPGLFHCYNDSGIPQTSNDIEHLFGKGKRILRKCCGRKTTAYGPGSSGGAPFLMGVALHGLFTDAAVAKFLKGYDPKAYTKLRKERENNGNSESRRRKCARNPDRYLKNILNRWEKT